MFFVFCFFSTVPPVVDPVHYGIHSAEPLWPIRGPKLPALQHLPPEAMLAVSSTTDRHWRPRQASRPKEKDVTSPRMANPQQRSDHTGNLLTTSRPPVQRPIQRQAIQQHPIQQRQPFQRQPIQQLPMHRPRIMPVQRQHILPVKRQHIQPVSHQPIKHQPNRRQHIQQQIIQQQLIKQQPAQKPLPHYIRQPVTSTAWTGYDRSTNRPIGRSPAVGPTMPTPLASTQTLAQHWPSRTQNTHQQPSAPNRFSSGASSGRSFGSVSGSDTISNNTASRSSLSSSEIVSSSIDRSDDSNVLLLSEKTVEPQRNETVDVSETTNHSQKKRARKPFFPFQFIIQQGHSRVRKYGAAEPVK